MVKRPEEFPATLDMGHVCAIANPEGAGGPHVSGFLNSASAALRCAADLSR